MLTGLSDVARAADPSSKIPAILDYGTNLGGPLPLFESAAILQYLAEKTGQLLPSDPRRRWEAIEWLTWQVGTLPRTRPLSLLLRHAAAGYVLRS